MAQTEMIDKLFLELSQVTTATTAKELAIHEKLRALPDAVEPFAAIVYNSDGRIPTEQLALAHWHNLAKALYASKQAV
jgi:hypothetical protein